MNLNVNPLSKIARINSPTVKSNYLWETTATVDINPSKTFSANIVQNLADCVSHFYHIFSGEMI